MPELHQAFFWICDECGRDNFERAIQVDPESVEGRHCKKVISNLVSDAEISAEDLGLAIHGNWLMSPERVKCKSCGEEYDVDFRPDESLEG